MTTGNNRLSYLSEEHQALGVVQDVGIFHRSVVTTDDGVPLAVFRAGRADRPTVVLVNALGVSIVFLAKLAKRLSQDYNVVAWESRGLPDYAACDADVDFSVERTALDAACVLAQTAQPVHAVVAYCSGSNAAMYALNHRLIDAQRLCVISPSIELASVTQRTDYQRTMLPIWPKVVSGGPRFAALVRALLQKAASAGGDSSEQELSILNGLPFATSESTYRYAQLQAACLKIDWAQELAGVRQPTLVLHAEQDDIIHIETSKAVARGIANARFLNIEKSGHFGVHTSRALGDAISQFLTEVPGQPNPSANKTSEVATSIDS